MILYTISLVCLSLISITMLFRANDLVRKGDSPLRPFAFRMRIIGFALVAAMPIGIVGARLSDVPSLPYETFFLVGLLCVFVTTPNHLPWWRWISKGE
jgi:hypothetical protein